MAELKFDHNITLEQLFLHIEIIKDRGDIFIIKYDGERDTDFITIIVLFKCDSLNLQLRFEGNNLNDLLKSAITNYYNENNICNDTN